MMGLLYTFHRPSWKGRQAKLRKLCQHCFSDLVWELTNRPS
jgi:hypothetical protein